MESPRMVRYRTIALRYRRAVCKFPAPFMVRYLTTNGKRFRLAWSGEPRRKWCFEVPYNSGSLVAETVFRGLLRERRKSLVGGKYVRTPYSAALRNAACLTAGGLPPAGACKR